MSSFSKEANAFFDTLIKSRFNEQFGDLKINEKQWEMETLRELSSDLGDGLHGTPEYSDDGDYAFINGNNLRNGHIVVDDNTKRVDYSQYLKYKINLDDTTVLISINGTLGNVAFYGGEKVILGKSACYVNLDTKRINKLFFKTLIQSAYFLEYLESEKTGTTINNISLKTMRNFLVPIPPMAEQDSFVRFIEQVDKSRMIFEQEVSRYDVLIKSRFIEEFGTPDNPNYGLVKINNLVAKKIDKVAKSYDGDDVIQYIDISSINKDSRSIGETTEYVVKDAPSRAQQCVLTGDILLSNVRPNLKTMAIVNSDEENLVCSSGFTVLRCEKCTPEYLITAITDDVFTDKLMRKATGSSYPAVTTKDVLSQEIPAGPESVQKTFSEFVKQVDKSRKLLLDRLKNVTGS